MDSSEPDISALVREAAMKALRRYLPEIDLDDEEIGSDSIEKMCQDVRLSRGSKRD